FDDLAARLPERSKRPHVATRAVSRLLPELAQRGGRRLLAGRNQALGDGPGAIVLASPEGTARMNQQDFEPGPAGAIKEDAGRAFGHPPCLARPRGQAMTTSSR